MLLANELRAAAETLGVLPPREHDYLTELMFRTETLHAFGDYVTAAYSVREQVETLIGKRRKLLGVQDPKVTRALDDAWIGHDREPSNVVIYATSNVVRHDIRPDTINTVTSYQMVEGGRAQVSVTVRLGMAGLMVGQGWTDAARDYVGPEGQLEILPLLDRHLISLSEMVTFVTTAIHEEFRRTGRR